MQKPRITKYSIFYSVYLFYSDISTFILKNPTATKQTIYSFVLPPRLLTSLSFILQRIQALIFGHEDKKTRFPLPGMSSFISPDKPNFKITTVQDSALPFAVGTSWSLFPTPSHKPGPSGQAAAHEKRASVIMKTSDVSKSSVKSC